MNKVLRLMWLSVNSRLAKVTKIKFLGLKKLKSY